MVASEPICSWTSAIRKMSNPWNSSKFTTLRLKLCGWSRPKGEFPAAPRAGRWFLGMFVENAPETACCVRTHIHEIQVMTGLDSDYLDVTFCLNLGNVHHAVSDDVYWLVMCSFLVGAVCFDDKSWICFFPTAICLFLIHSSSTGNWSSFFLPLQKSWKLVVSLGFRTSG